MAHPKGKELAATENRTDERSFCPQENGNMRRSDAEK
jgi:hypothetical protein